MGSLFANTDRLSEDDRFFVAMVETKLERLIELADSLHTNLQDAATKGGMAHPDEIQVAANNLEVTTLLLSEATVERIEAGFGLE